MIRDYPPHGGPLPGPQPDVIYCPFRAAHVRPIPATHQPSPTSHSHECEHGHVWEINRLTENARDWNGARPNWNLVRRSSRSQRSPLHVNALCTTMSCASDDEIVAVKEGE